MQCVETKEDYTEKLLICFISVTLKKLVRPENVGPYYVIEKGFV
jgi:hypothetical protein